jgi:hypothetical protein
VALIASVAVMTMLATIIHSIAGAWDVDFQLKLAR